ncbi:MAG: glycoside hydrolase family 3 C-terminal domain-containing protein [Clostridia bacterium]|nr:glycoside hydrolase family 3 C-terminal domain-containing protein [Clostridia bacterium]
MQTNDIKNLIAQMTLEEKASLCSGLDFGHTKPIERLNIPALEMSDGPHGMRKQEQDANHLGVGDSIPAVCFPAGCASASSWDKNVLRMIGETLAKEYQAENVGVILGPAINIKRSPLCGRNFEYLSEDPFLSSELAAAYIQGVQSQNVGTSLKHFFANNQEYRRMTASSDVDERTMREIYLASFETAVKKGKPWTVMNSYNRVNGEYVGEDKKYLTDVLRGEWGFDGVVVSDWGAVNDRVKALAAGGDLEMPGSGGVNDALIVEAVKNGTLDEKIVDQAVERILTILYRFLDNRQQETFDRDKDHEIARQAEEESIVLLKNESGILPIREGTKVAVIGKYAKAPRYQGGGSSHVNSSRISAALESLAQFTEVSFAEGFRDDKDETDEAMLAEAVQAAAAADMAVIFAGLPDAFESEGYDRKHMRMPDCQNALIDAVCKVQPNTVVVLHNGAPVEMPWISQVKGVLEAYLGGQAVGAAVANVLTGKVNPSGRLTETFPLRLEDTPCFLTFGGENERCDYSEGVFVGYRYYVSKKMPVLFSFGHGLSYTEFAYSNLRLDRETMKDDETLTVSVDVENVGSVPGKEVVQLYVAPGKGGFIRPVRELKGFEKIALVPGEKKTVRFTLDKRSFALWDVRQHDWYVEEGDYAVQICKNAETVALTESIHVSPVYPYMPIFTVNSTLGDIMRTEKGQAVFAAMQSSAPAAGDFGMDGEFMAAIMDSMPLRWMVSFVPGFTWDAVNGILAQLNQ